MPINTQIVHGIRPREVRDPLESYGKALSLKQMTQQSEFNDQRTRAAEFELQQGREASMRAEKFRQAIDQGADFKTLAGIDPKAAHDWATAQNQRLAA